MELEDHFFIYEVACRLREAEQIHSKRVASLSEAARLITNTLLEIRSIPAGSFGLFPAEWIGVDVYFSVKPIFRSRNDQIIITYLGQITTKPAKVEECHIDEEDFFVAPTTSQRSWAHIDVDKGCIGIEYIEPSKLPENLDVEKYLREALQDCLDEITGPCKPARKPS